LSFFNIKIIIIISLFLAFFNIIFILIFIINIIISNITNIYLIKFLQEKFEKVLKLICFFDIIISIGRRIKLKVLTGNSKVKI